MKTRSLLLLFARILALAILYRLAVVLSLNLAYVQSNTSPVWPPTGIAIAALLLFGINLWPGVLLSVLVGSMMTGAPFGLALGMSIGNTLEAVVGAYLLLRVVNVHNALDRIRDVVGFVLVALVSTSISATIGALTLMVTGSGDWSAFGSIWITWWIGDLLGALVIAPFLLVWFTPVTANNPRPQHLRSALIYIMLALVTWYVFFTPAPAGIAHQAMLYVIFPFMIFASLRHGTRGAVSAILLISGIAIWGTAQGLGPFALQSVNESLILLQTFMGVVSLTALILASATSERHTASAALHQKVSDLAALNDASQAFLGALDEADLYRTICQLAVKRFEADAAWIDIARADDLIIKPVVAVGISAENLPDLRASWADSTNLPVTDTAVVRQHERGKDAFGYAAFGSFPLSIGGKPFGAVKLLSRSAGFFSRDRELLLQSYANLATVAIQNSWLLERVRKGNEQLHALTQRLMKAQEEERLHLSRELHDESGQLLAAMMVQLGLLEHNSEHPPRLGIHLIELRQSVNALQENLHKLAVNLRPASLDHLGLVTALQQYVTDFSRQYNIHVEIETTGMQDKRLKNEIETALFRIVQESLTNVVMHAQATHVDILISRHNNHLVTIIEDDGVGFTPSSPTGEHLGLFGMRERVEMLGGQFTIESEPGKGTTVRVEVPDND